MHALNLENPVLLFSRLRKNQKIFFLFLLFIIWHLALLHIYTKSQNVPSYFHLVPSLNLSLYDLVTLRIYVSAYLNTVVTMVRALALHYTWQDFQNGWSGFYVYNNTKARLLLWFSFRLFCSWAQMFILWVYFMCLFSAILLDFVFWTTLYMTRFCEIPDDDSTRYTYIYIILLTHTYIETLT